MDSSPRWSLKYIDNVVWNLRIDNVVLALRIDNVVWNLRIDNVVWAFLYSFFLLLKKKYKYIHCKNSGVKFNTPGVVRGPHQVGVNFNTSRC